METKSEINQALIKEKLIKVLFSSIKKKSFSQTFSHFVEILYVCLQEEISYEKFSFNLLNEAIKLLNMIDNELIASKKDIQIKLNIIEKELNFIIDNLVMKGQLQLFPIKGREVLSLTEKGKNNFNKIVNNFSIKNIFDLKNYAKFSDIPKSLEIPSFVGFFVANKDGIALLTTEVFDGALLKYIKDKVDNATKNDKLDVQLIPMFISALEKFSKEINIQNLSGFNLKGTNLKMRIFGFDNYTVTFFLNPNVNINLIENKIKNYFTQLFKINRNNFEYAIQKGSFTKLKVLESKGRQWLENLNKAYNQAIVDLESFDLEEVNFEFSLILEKIKKLKINLMKAILAENFEEIKELAKFSQDLRLSFVAKTL